MREEDLTNEPKRIGVVYITSEFRVCPGRTADTMKIEILLQKDGEAEGHLWQGAIEATPTLIGEISRRLCGGDESVMASMSIHACGTEVIWWEICAPCSENGVLTGGCKKLDGPCSTCMYYKRACRRHADTQRGVGL
ncbi:hypothetical protein ACJZ2D_014355 [Fusarium nematophilum]